METNLGEHLSELSRNVLKLEILLLNFMDEMEKQGFIDKSEIIEKAENEFENLISKVKEEVEIKLEEIKNEITLSSIMMGQRGDA